MRPAVSYWEPWHGQNQPSYGPAWPSGTQPRCVQIWTITNQASLPAAELIAKLGNVHGLGRCDLLVGALAHHDRLAAPLDDEGFAGLDGRDINLDLRQRERRGVRIHLVDDRPRNQRGANHAHRAGGDIEKVATRRFRMRGVSACQTISPLPFSADGQGRDW